MKNPLLAVFGKNRNRKEDTTLSCLLPFHSSYSRHLIPTTYILMNEINNLSGRPIIIVNNFYGGQSQGPEKVRQSTLSELIAYSQFEQQQQKPSSPQPPQQQQQPAASPSSSPNQSHEPRLLKGSINRAIVKVLYDLDALDEDNAVPEEKITENSGDVVLNKIASNPHSSCRKLSSNAKREVKRLISCGYLGKNAKGYFLTKKAIEAYEAKIAVPNKDNEKDSNEPAPTSPKKRFDEYLDDARSDESNNNNEEEEGDDSLKDKLFILALYFLREKNYCTLSFNRKDVLEEVQNVQDMFPKVRFIEGNDALEQNIRDGYIENSYERFWLSDKGKEIANEIATRHIETISVEPPKKRQKH